jgi:glycosyltransferase involved in cell wall biosynthesis
MKTILPKVSVVMSVFNSELYLKSAIESILNQSYSNLEFIIINDCSTDNSETIIKSFNDNRIKYIKEFENIGLETALNKNFMLAEGEFIARMDADDIASPDRLKHQVEFLMANGEIDLVGTWYEKITNTVSLGMNCGPD